MMWVLVALCSIELIVDHLVLMHWYPGVAAILSVATLSGLVWLVRVILSFRRLPVLLTEDRIVMRVGTLREVVVPLASVKALPTDWTAESLKARGVVNLALIAYPNIVIELDPPIVGERRTITTVAHRLDDPAAFTAALNAVGAAA
ncbi:hypothetical protein U1701_15265 [Sphingomonas sp. PB2P19]